MVDKVNKPGQKIFFNGKYFETLEEAMEYDKKYQNEIASMESFYQMWKRLGNDIWANCLIRDTKKTNKEFNEMFESLLIEALKIM